MNFSSGSLCSSRGSEAVSVNMADSGVTGGFGESVRQDFVTICKYFDNFEETAETNCLTFIIDVLGSLGLTRCEGNFRMLTLACKHINGDRNVASSLRICVKIHIITKQAVSRYLRSMKMMGADLFDYIVSLALCKPSRAIAS